MVYAVAIWSWITDHATVLAMVVSALAAVSIARYTVRLTKANTAQAKLTSDGIELAREEFLAANPPHLVVRNVHCRDANPGDNISISFEVINNGKADAYIVASAFRTDFVREVETFHDLTLVAVGEPAKNALGDVILIPGAVLRRTYDTAFKWQPEHFHDHGILTAGYFFGGKLLYQDAKGNRRRLGFLRRLSLPSRRFRPVSDPEFEYDD